LKGVGWERRMIFDDCHGFHAYSCAMDHLRWLVRSLSRTTPFWLAYAWNAGASSVEKPEMNQRAYAYAQRVENLYNDALSQRLP
jgi:hypothetical protein